MKINNNNDYLGIVSSSLYNSNEIQSTNKITADRVKVAVENASEAKTPIQKYTEGRGNCPYSEYADASGTIVYKGVVFNCDTEKNRLCLGDVTNLKNCLTIRLTRGSLVVNKDNLSQLSDAIGMFSPEDANIIMRALNEYQRIKDKLNEIEDNKMSIGEKDTDTEKENKTQKDTSSDSQNAYHVLKGNSDNVNKDTDVNTTSQKQKEKQTKDSEKIENKLTKDLQDKHDELLASNLTKEQEKEQKIKDITEDMIERLLA